LATIQRIRLAAAGKPSAAHYFVDQAANNLLPKEFQEDAFFWCCVATLAAAVGFE
jgi:hypothetical protein